MKVFNGNGRASKRFWITLIGFCGCLLAAVVKNFLPGMDTALVITGAGLIGTYNAAESWRPSGQNGNGNGNGNAIPADQAGVTMKMDVKMEGTKP